MTDKKMRTLAEPKRTRMGIEEMGSMPPSFSVDEKQLPEIKKWKIGEKYELYLEVEMTRISKNEWREDSPINASLKITKIGCSDEEDDQTKEAKKGHD